MKRHTIPSRVSTSVLFVIVIIIVAHCCCSGVTMASSFSSSSNNNKAHAAAAPVFVTTSADLFNKLSDVLVPAINSLARNLTIPGLHSAHFNFSSFKLKSFDIQKNWFEFVPPNGLLMHVDGLELATPHVDFVLFDKIIFTLKCSGKFWASTSDASAFFVLPIERNAKNGTLTVGNITNTSVSVGHLTVNHTLSSGLCKLGQDIIQIFIGNLNKVIEKVVKEEIGPMISATATSLLKEIFQKIPVKISGDPVASATDDTLTVPLDLLDLFIPSPSPSPPAPPPPPPTPVIELDIHHRRHHHRHLPSMLRRKQNDLSPPPPQVSDRDISLALPAKSLNTLLADLTRQGKFTRLNISVANLTTAWFRPYMPLVFSTCPDCPIVLDLSTSEDASPYVLFSENNASVAINGTVLSVKCVKSNSNGKKKHNDGISSSSSLSLLYDEGSTTTINLFSLSIFSLGGAYNFTLDTWAKKLTFVHFDIELSSFDFKVASSQVGKLQPQILAWVVRYALDTLLLPILNELPGLPLGGVTVDNITLSKPVVKVDTGMMLMGLDLSF